MIWHTIDSVPESTISLLLHMIVKGTVKDSESEPSAGFLNSRRRNFKHISAFRPRYTFQLEETMTEANIITLYDIASNIPDQAISSNTWKTRSVKCLPSTPVPHNPQIDIELIRC